MLSKRFIKRVVGTFLSLFMFSTVFANINIDRANAIPATEDKYISGDKQFSINILGTEIPAGTNPGAVDFNGNGKYDENENLPLKGTEDFKVPDSVEKANEDFFKLLGLSGNILRNNVIVAREDIEGYNKPYLRDASTGGCLYLKVKLEGNVGQAFKSTLDKAVQEFQKNSVLLSQGKGSQAQFKEQETLATVIQNSFGMKDNNGKLINDGVNIVVNYSTGLKTDSKKFSVTSDVVFDTTTAKVNQYTNAYNAPKIVDAEGNLYLKLYGLPSGIEITGVQLEGTLSFPSLVEESIAKKISQQTSITTQKGIIPFIDPMLTESINIDNANPLDPLTIMSTSAYFVGVGLDEKGEIVAQDSNVVEYIGPVSSDDKSQGYNHANIRPVENAIALYDVLYDPENTVKRIQVKDIDGKIYSAKILKEGSKVGQMQTYAKVDGLVSDSEKNSTMYKDLVVEGLEPDKIYKFVELIVTFNSGDGDVNRRFTNYDTLSVNPIPIRTMSSSSSESGDLLKEFELKTITPTKAEFALAFNNPNKTIKSVVIKGDTIANSVYDEENNKITLYGLTPNNTHSKFELIVTLTTGEELGLVIDDFTTKRITSAQEWIEGFYHIFFLRDGDPTGMAYWTSKLASQEISVNYFTSNIVNEQEYKEKNLDNAKYVERMYRSVTGRTSDAEGLAWWTKTLEETIVQLGDRTQGMQAISARMLGETETRSFLNSIGLRVE